LALEREINEEINLDIESLEYAGTSKVILEGIVWQ
jgi:NADH pyrophosphatase NudC (nudix superfamily)